MQIAPKPADEAARLDTLHSLSILDTPPEERFDRLTRLARRLFDVPIALVSLVDDDRQWFKSHAGLDVTQTSRDVSFCAHALLEGNTMVIQDALNDNRFHDNPLVTGTPGIRFYAGRPLTAPNGAPIGTLSPTLGVGMIAGAAELWLRKPQMGDFASLRHDIAETRGWWHNKVARIFLIFFLTSIGGALGNYLTLPGIIGQFFR